jgi:hypothetical protein
VDANDTDRPDTATAGALPFKALIATSSFFVLVLAVAGFSLRWNYYYNFGLQNIVTEAPLSSLAVSAVEIIRTPENIGTLLLLVIQFMVPFQLALWFLRRLSNSRNDLSRRIGEISTGVLGLDSALLVDLLRAGLVVFVAFRAGGIAGSRDYLVNAVEATSRLPRVTVIANTVDGEAKGNPLPIVCDTRPLMDRTGLTAPAFVGDPQAVMRLGAGSACSSDAQSWRLLYRDDKFAYLFRTVLQPGIRPEMLVLPSSDRLTLVLQ